MVLSNRKVHRDELKFRDFNEFLTLVMRKIPNQFEQDKFLSQFTKKAKKRIRDKVNSDMNRGNNRDYDFRDVYENFD